MNKKCKRKLYILKYFNESQTELSFPKEIKFSVRIETWYTFSEDLKLCSHSSFNR